VAPPKSLIAQPEESAEKIILPPTSQSIKPVTPKTSVPEDMPARTTDVAPPTEKITTAAPKTEAPIIQIEKVQPPSISPLKEKKKIVERTAAVPKKVPTAQSNKTPPQDPEKAPVQEEKPATDWGGSMQWGESRPKSP
jgi:hypothetical protein